MQNIIALTDSIFLFHYNDIDFRAIGLVSVFYLIISAIGYGFSRGGQIIIARRFGQGNNDDLVRSFYALLYFELLLAFVMFVLIQFLGQWFFEKIVSDPPTLEACIDYLIPRSYGIFFSYLGVIIVALYTGIAKTSFIVIDVVILATVNMVLNYLFIFGKLGVPEMGIAGAAWASTIAELIAFIAFIIYMIFEKDRRVTGLFAFPKLDLPLIALVYKVSIPIVMQVIIGLGAWFVFFSLIENMGGKELEISNLVRIVFLILSIPTWGFSSGINTLTSNIRGAGNEKEVIPVIWRTVLINFVITMVITLPVVLFPETTLYPIFGKADMSIIHDAQPIFYVMFLILISFSIGAILFNGLLGIGATNWGFRIQGIMTVFYLAYIFIIVKYYNANLIWAWFSEVFYWFFILLICIWILYRFNWKIIKI